MPQKPDEKLIREVLDDVQAITKSRFYEDPDPVASPVEMFRMPEGQEGGEPFSKLSVREKVQVLGDYTNWHDYEERGITFEQMEQVFWNVVQGKPRELWMEGTGLDHDRFHDVATHLQDKWVDDGLSAFEAWKDRTPAQQAGYLASFAAVHDVSFERFSEVAGEVLGIDDTRLLRQEFDHARNWAGKNGEERMKQAHARPKERKSVLGYDLPEPSPQPEQSRTRGR